MEHNDTGDASEKRRRALKEAAEEVKIKFFAPDRDPTPPEQFRGFADRMQSQCKEAGSTKRAPEEKRDNAALRWAHGVKPEPEKPGPLNMLRRERERQAAEDKKNGRG